jgi:hypothetical protein
MTSEETHEEDNIEAAEEDDGPSPPTSHAPRIFPVGRLSGDMKEFQLQAIVGDGKKKYPVCVRLRGGGGKVRTARYICKHANYSSIPH